MNVKSWVEARESQQSLPQKACADQQHNRQGNLGDDEAAVQAFRFPRYRAGARPKCLQKAGARSAKGGNNPKQEAARQRTPDPV